MHKQGDRKPPSQHRSKWQPTTVAMMFLLSVPLLLLWLHILVHELVNQPPDMNEQLENISL